MSSLPSRGREEGAKVEWARTSTHNRKETERGGEREERERGRKGNEGRKKRGENKIREVRRAKDKEKNYMKTAKKINKQRER